MTGLKSGDFKTCQEDAISLQHIIKEGAEKPASYKHEVRQHIYLTRNKKQVKPKDVDPMVAGPNSVREFRPPRCQVSS